MVNGILGNDGGSVNVWCVPVGNYGKEKDNVYHRVYNDNDKFTYHKLTENGMFQKGQAYWINKTLCGSETKIPRKGGNSRYEYTLVKAYKKYIIPEME